MTDEMRVALVAVAAARGMDPGRAWELVDDLPVDGRPIRDVLEDLDRRAVADIYPHGV